jgi:hypothetical protein
MMTSKPIQNNKTIMYMSPISTNHWPWAFPFKEQPRSSGLRGDIKHQQKFPSVFARHNIQWKFSYAEGKVEMLDPGGVLGVLFSEIPASFFHYPPSIMAESENKQCTLPQVHLEECLLWEHPAVRLLPYTSILPAPHKIILKRIPV